jgi:hypothetical protein
MKIILTTLLILLINTNTKSQMNNTSPDSSAANKSIKILELRSYVTKTGIRDKFIDFFESNFIQSQNILGGYILGQNRVKNAEDNFFWLRGFTGMTARSKYLPAFYRSDYWKARRSTANEMLVNNDNVYLLKPLSFREGSDTAINSNVFSKKKGVIVIDYYIANTRLKELIDFFGARYMPFLKTNGITDITTWVSELQENDFPGLPVFQDKNLLVTIVFYKDEKEYDAKMKQLNAEVNKTLLNEMREIVTTKNTVVLYPTAKSFSK